MTVCSTCKHANYCEIVAGGYSSQVKSCRDYRKGETTNEEWFTSLSTEEKAKTIVCLEVNALHKWKKGLVESDVDEIKRWLKQPHTVKE